MEAPTPEITSPELRSPPRTMIRRGSAPRLPTIPGGSTKIPLVGSLSSRKGSLSAMALPVMNKSNDKNETLERTSSRKSLVESSTNQSPMQLDKPKDMENLLKSSVQKSSSRTATPPVDKKKSARAQANPLVRRSSRSSSVSSLDGSDTKTQQSKSLKRRDSVELRSRQKHVTVTDLASRHQAKMRSENQNNTAPWILSPPKDLMTEVLETSTTLMDPVAEDSSNTIKLTPIRASPLKKKFELPKLDLTELSMLETKTPKKTDSLRLALDSERADSDEEIVQPPQTFDYNETDGTFKVDGFQIRECGITMAPYGRLPHQQIGGIDGLAKIGYLGKGASGQVFEMLHEPTLTLVAVKNIACFEQNQRHQLVKELRTLYGNFVPLDTTETGTVSAELLAPACPNIVTFYDAFINPKEGNVSIVMEYMDGGCLQEVVDSGGCDCEETLAHISENILRGLLFLHNNKQIHRDIKPSNLLINHKGEVKISDFGIVREMVDDKANTFVGTMVYMSPERINGQTYSYSSDIWSFGLSIIACAMGKFPLPMDGGYWGILHCVNNQPIPNLPASRFSSTVIDFVSKCIEKDPEKRASAAELLEHPFISRRGARPANPVGMASATSDKLEEICSKFAQFQLSKLLESKAREKEELEKEYEEAITKDKDTPPPREPAPIPNLTKVSAVRCENLSDQLGLPVSVVRGRVNYHIREANEYLRRFRLYNH